jgi:zinc protease
MVLQAEIERIIFRLFPKMLWKKMIWAEADKLGYFINTVTEPFLAKEKQVVKNEKKTELR